MAQHKAPTEVVIAAPDEKSAFARFVERTWLPFVVLAVLVAAVIIVMQVLSRRAEAARAADWDKVVLAMEEIRPREDPASVDVIQEAVESIQDEDARAWGLYYSAIALREARRYDDARSALQRLASEYPDHPIVSERFELPGRAAPITLAENLDQALAAQAEWERAHPELFDNPPPPADAPKVRLQTSEGDIIVQLYTDLAPKHAENFVKLAREGFYDGTRFHRVIRGFMIQGGDPESRSDDRSKWGQGGPGYTIEREENELRHFPGYLSAAKKPGETESSGSQFFITTGAAHHLDGQHVIFGKVIEGMDVVRAIEQGEVETGVAGASDRPVNPVTILSTEVLE